MPTLVTARATYSARCYSEVWRHVGSRFIDQLLAQAQSDLYVTSREPGGVEPNDVRHYAENGHRGPFLIIAPAGLGKTTWLKNTLTDQLLGTRKRIWIDVEDHFPHDGGGDADTFARLLEALIGQKLRSVIDSYESSEESWYRFFVDHWRDPAGLSRTLMEEMRTGPLSHGAQSSLQALLAQANDQPLAILRIQLRYLHKLTGTTPFVVLDNVDQLPADKIIAIVRTATQLSMGVEEHPPSDSAKVMLAMRPITVMTKSVHEHTRMLKAGELKPPSIVELLERRLAHFLSSFDGVVFRGKELRIPMGSGRLSLMALAEHLDVSEQQIAHEVVRRVTRELLLVREGDRPLVHLVHEMTNSNTRLTLIALAGYAASGHAPWLEALRNVGANHPGVISWRKALKGMLLGTREVYETNESWVLNLFNAGVRDPSGCTVRLRLLELLSVAQPPGLPLVLVQSIFQSLFRYSGHFTHMVVSSLQKSGLIEERTPDHFTITRAGHRYASELVENFEYLQHVVVDSYTTQEFVVPYRSSEDALVRYRRVLQFARWLRELECHDQLHIVEAGLERRYEEWFRQTTMCGRIAHVLVENANHLRHSFAHKDLEWRGLSQEAQELLHLSRLENMRPKPAHSSGNQAQLLISLLELRFREVPASVRSRVATAGTQQVADWGRQVFTASSLDDVFRETV